jgi:hypothetical protein
MDVSLYSQPEEANVALDDVRVRLRQKLERSFGAEEASILMDRPPGGWNDLVTVTVLDSKLEALEAKLETVKSELSASLRSEIRDQTRWLATLVIAAQAVLIAAVAAIGTLLRFA